MCIKASLYTSFSIYLLVHGYYLKRLEQYREAGKESIPQSYTNNVATTKKKHCCMNICDIIVDTSLGFSSAIVLLMAKSFVDIVTRSTAKGLWDLARVKGPGLIQANRGCNKGHEDYQSYTYRTPVLMSEIIPLIRCTRP